MEITKLNIISDFVSPLAKVPQIYHDSLWKWSALILALIATFTSVFTRIKLMVRSIKRSSSKQLLQCFDDDFDFSDDDDETSSTASEFDDQENDDQEFDDDDDDKSNLRRRRSSRDFFSWSDFTAGKSVVKLWDSLGLGLDFQGSSGNEISIWDSDKYQNISTFFAGESQIPAVSKPSPAVVYLAEMSENDRFVLGAYDRRVSNEIPAVCAEWGPQRANVVGVEKVYVKGGGRSGGKLQWET